MVCERKESKQVNWLQGRQLYQKGKNLRLAIIYWEEKKKETCPPAIDMEVAKN